MPLLIVEFSGKRKRATLAGRASIGRTPSNDVVIEHPAVSRAHAVIEKIGDSFFIIDVHSKNGTLIGNRELKDRAKLADGDRIAIGPAVLTFRLSEDYVEPTGASATLSETHAGILMACECGAQLWVPKEMIGGRGQCQKCGRTLTLGESDPIAAAPNDPQSPLAAAPLGSDELSRVAASRIRTAAGSNSEAIATPPVKAKAIAQPCSICQWKIEPDDTPHICPSCGLAFHEECWIENRGCSAYGCDQVNILDQGAEAETPEEIGHPPEIIHQPPRLPWEFILLAASVVGSLIGLLTFGIPALLALLASGAFLAKNRHSSRMNVLIAAMAVALLGLIGGLLVSRFWWLDIRVGHRG